MVICIRRGHFSISSFRLSCGLLFAPFFVRDPPSSYPAVPTKLLEALKIHNVELEVKREPACPEYLGSFSVSVRLQSRISTTDHFRQGIGTQVLGELQSPAGKVTAGTHYPPEGFRDTGRKGRLPESTSRSHLLGVSITAGAFW